MGKSVGPYEHDGAWGCLHFIGIKRRVFVVKLNNNEELPTKLTMGSGGPGGEAGP